MGETAQKAKGGKRPGAGRPATGFDPVRTFRISDAAIARVDSWASRQNDQPGRSEAIRRLVELALTLDRLWHLDDLVAKPSSIAPNFPAPGSTSPSHQDSTDGQEVADWPLGERGRI